jgi:hypothetical protein
MEFRIIQSGELCGSCSIVLAEGNIERDTAEKLKAFAMLHRLPETTQISFNSNGGSLLGGLELGRVIREHRFRTNLSQVGPVLAPARCASACAYAFLGGVVRTKDEGSLYGVHQFSSNQQTSSGLSDAQVVFAALSNYVREMGASTELLEFASVTDVDDIRWIDDKALKSLNVITRSGSALDPTWQLDIGGGGLGEVSLNVEGLQSNYTIVRMYASCPMLPSSNNFPFTILFENNVPYSTDLRSMLSREPPILPLAEREQMAKLSMATVYAEQDDGSRRELFRKKASASGYQRSDISIVGSPIYTVGMSLTLEEFRRLEDLPPSDARIIVGFDQKAFGLQLVEFETSGLKDVISEFLLECRAP